MEKVPLELACPTPVGEHVIVADGTGYGGSRAAALTAARADADSKLAIGIQCVSGCKPVVSETAPVYDSSVPAYVRWGSGFEARLQRSKSVNAACEPAG